MQGRGGGRETTAFVQRQVHAWKLTFSPRVTPGVLYPYFCVTDKETES